ncbi:MAG: response regulator, partial [Acidobacteriales bacterium]
MSSSTTPERPAAVRILLVDNNKGGSVARKAVLEEHGHRVTTANNAEDALDHFTKTKYD